MQGLRRPPHPNTGHSVAVASIVQDGLSIVRVVINAYSARQGGGQTYLRNLLAHVPSDSSLEVVVFAPECLSLPVGGAVRRGTTRWPTANPLSRLAWERWVLPRLLCRMRADILFCPGGVVATKVPSNCRVVTMFRNMIPFDGRTMATIPLGAQRLRNILLRRAILVSLRNADLTIFVSDYARGVIEALARIPNPITIPHGIDASFREPDPPQAKSPASGEEPYILYVSKFDSYKHHAEVVAGYALLPVELRNRVRLVLVGETENPQAKAVERLIQYLGVADRVDITGPLPAHALPAIYQHAALNVFASSCENCPNILLEALAAGRPIICSDVQPMPEFGGAGIGYFAPDDPLSISAAMRMYLENRTIAEECAEAARRRSMDFDWSDAAGRTWREILKVACAKS